MPGIVKIGFSTKDPALRARELEGTGSPDAFVVEYHALVLSARAVEQQVHSELLNHHYAKEFFQISVDDAVFAIKRVVINQGKTILYDAMMRTTSKTPYQLKVVSKPVNEGICQWIVGCNRVKQSGSNFCAMHSI